MRRIITSRQQRVECVCMVHLPLTHLDVGEGPVGVPRDMAVPEIDVPADELADPFEAVRVGAPMFSGKHDVAR